MKRFLDITITVIGLAMVAYHLTFSQFIMQPSFGHQNTHLLFSFLILFLFRLKQYSGHSWKGLLIGALVILSIVSGIYMQLNYQDLDARAGGVHNISEIAFGVIIIILVFIGSWQEFGAPLPIMAFLFVLYTYLGHFLPEPWTVSEISFEEIISQLCINMEGVYGLVLGISANYIFLFMIFALLMTTTGGIKFFSYLGKYISRYFKSGSAVMAVITSGLVGSITGQSAANVAITGSFTIPAMKKAGYRPVQAAGIEAAASSGGPIIPPVMGVAAFLMSGILNISYFKIATMAVLPAILYVFSCFSYVIFMGRRLGINEKPEKIGIKPLLLTAPVFLGPLIVMICLFVRGYSPLYVSFWAVVSIIIFSLIRKKNRPSLNELIEGLVKGAKLGSQVAISCALLGIVIKVVTMTGMAIIIPQIVRSFCGNNLVLLLVMTGFISIILGMGLPAATSYVLVAIVIAPILIPLGVPMVTAHFFTFYFCNFSYITPPVALAAVFASKLAKANYIKTGIEAAKVGIAGFVIPFLMVFSPGILLQFNESAVLFTFELISCFLILIGLQAAITGFFMISLDALKRILYFCVSFDMLYGCYADSVYWIVVGIVAFFLLIIWQYFEKQKLKNESIYAL